MAVRPNAARLAQDLVAWYRANRRALPWRTDPSPYRTLLSELMCQQTRVDTALPYFHRFLERWPTLEALAAAEEDDVVHAWAGLGYYSRARNLHRAAKQAVAMGGLPRDPDALRKLPGIGPYTAGAIASIAFGVPTPAVDGNVERVLSRLDARDADPKSTAGRRALWERAAELVHASSAPGDLNQALMELGALICTPRGPSCASCPVASSCLAREAGLTEHLPRRSPRKAVPTVLGVAAIVRRSDGALLLGKRPPGLLGGLWEPVVDEVAPTRDPEVLAAALRRRAGIEIARAEPLGDVVHVFSHRRLELAVYRVVPRQIGAPSGGGYEELQWVSGTPSESVALSRLAGKILALEAGAQARLFAADPPAGW